MAINQYSTYYEWLSTYTKSYFGSIFGKKTVSVNTSDFKTDIENLMDGIQSRPSKVYFGFNYKGGATSGDVKFTVDGATKYDYSGGTESTFWHEVYIDDNYASKCSSRGVPNVTISMTMNSLAYQEHHYQFKIKWIPEFFVLISHLLGSNSPSINGYYELGTAINSKVSERDGYYFVEWSDGNTERDRTFIINSSLNITANYRPYTYNIILNNQLADIDPGTTNIYARYNHGWHKNYNDSDTDKINSINIPKKKGYIFKGYFINEDYSGEQVISEDGAIIIQYPVFTLSDTTLYAKWEPIEYTLIYDDGNGNQSKEIVLKYNEDYFLKNFDDIFTLDNYPSYTLNYIAPEATIPFTPQTEIFYPSWTQQWQDIEKNIIYNYDNNQSSISMLRDTSGEKVILYPVWPNFYKKDGLSAPYRKYHNFNYWLDEQTNQKYIYNDSISLYEKVTSLKANWKKVAPRVFIGKENLEQTYISKNKKIEKIFMYITPSHLGEQGNHIEI